jgi:amino acid transporter
MPLEGGLYVWAHRAFGDLAGFLTAWNILIYAIAVTAAILYAIPSEIAYFIGPSAAWLPENRLVSLAIVTAMVGGVTLATFFGPEVGKWVQNIGGIAILAVFAALILLPIWGLARHQPLLWSPLSFEAPPRDLRTMSLFGQIMFGGLCGLGTSPFWLAKAGSPNKPSDDRYGSRPPSSAYVYPGHQHGGGLRAAEFDRLYRADSSNDARRSSVL